MRTLIISAPPANRQEQPRFVQCPRRCIGFAHLEVQGLNPHLRHVGRDPVQQDATNSAPPGSGRDGQVGDLRLVEQEQRHNVPNDCPVARLSARRAPAPLLGHQKSHPVKRQRRFERFSAPRVRERCPLDGAHGCEIGLVRQTNHRRSVVHWTCRVRPCSDSHFTWASARRPYPGSHSAR